MRCKKNLSYQCTLAVAGKKTGAKKGSQSKDAASEGALQDL